MDLIQIARPWNELSRGAAKVNWANSLTSGLKNALLFGSGAAYDAAVQSPRAITAILGASSFAGSRFGGALYTPNGSGVKITLSEDWSGPCTVICRCLINGVDSPWGALWEKKGSSARQLQFGRSNTTNTWYVSRDGANVTTLGSTSITGDSSSLVTIAVINSTADGTGAPHYYYKNGALVQSASQSAVSQAAGAGDLYLGCEESASSSFDADAYWYSFLRFDRVLAAWEIAAISSNLEQLFVPQRKLIPFGAASGGLPTLTAITASAITTSGATLTITA